VIPLVPFGTVEQDFEPVPGMRVRVSPVSKVTLVELDYFADPDKVDPAWLERATQGLSEGDIEREYRRNRTLVHGDAFYFEFLDNGGRKTFAHRSPGLIEGLHVSRSFDFGVRRPACIWYQYDPKSDRLWYLREFMPRDCGTHDFRDVVRYLSGEMAYEELAGDALYWADEVAAREWNPAPPWFEPQTTFMNFAGNEAFRRQAAAMRDPEEATDANIMAAGGIHLVEWNGPVLARTKVVRRLLKLRSDGFPGMFVDPACEEWLRCLEGALVFHLPTVEDPLPNKPRKDGHFDNIHDAATYGPVHEVPAPDVVPQPLPKRISFHNRMRVEEDAEPNSVGWKETRDGGIW